MRIVGVTQPSGLHLFSEDVPAQCYVLVVLHAAWGRQARVMAGHECVPSRLHGPWPSSTLWAVV
jgi:hypothetical protein